MLAVTDETFYMVRATQAKVTALTLAPALFASAAVGIQNPNACSIQHSIPLVFTVPLSISQTIFTGKEVGNL